jgi:hypothetical protein
MEAGLSIERISDPVDVAARIHTPSTLSGHTRGLPYTMNLTVLPRHQTRIAVMSTRLISITLLSFAKVIEKAMTSQLPY